MSSSNTLPSVQTHRFDSFTFEIGVREETSDHYFLLTLHSLQLFLLRLPWKVRSWVVGTPKGFPCVTSDFRVRDCNTGCGYNRSHFLMIYLRTYLPTYSFVLLRCSSLPFFKKHVFKPHIVRDRNESVVSEERLVPGT